MAPTIEAQIDSLDDLLIAARLFEINETPEALKELWERRPEPIRVGGSENSLISQIIKVWNKDAATYALSNNGQLIIADDNRYDNTVIREGLYIYKNHFLQVDIENILPYAKYFDKIWEDMEGRRWMRGLPEDFLDSLFHPILNEGICFPIYTGETLMEVLASWGYVQTPLRRPDLEENRNRVRQFYEKLGDNATLTPDAGIDEDGIFQVIGKKIHEWLIFPEADYRNWNYPMRDLLNYLAYRIYAGLRFYLEDGTYKIWLGRFSFEYTIKTEGRKRRYFFDGVELRDLWKAWSQLQYYHDKEEYLENLQGLRKQRITDQKEIELKLEIHLSPDEQVPGTLKLQNRKRRLYVGFPGSDRTYHIKDGKKWLSLFDVGLYPRSLPVDVFSLFKILSQHVPEDEVLEYLERSIQKGREAEERARSNLLAFIEEHSNRVREGEIESRWGTKKGYIVRGKKKDYFVGEYGRVLTYPGGDYVCLRDDEKKVLPRSDRILGRILLCLNDLELSGEVSTLN